MVKNTIIICSISINILLSICSYKNNNITKTTKIETDTIYLYKENYNKIDSLKYINDSIEEKLIVANIKLKRIEYYNNIANKGNNIKYLRGWINRVLKEE